MSGLIKIKQIQNNNLIEPNYIIYVSRYNLIKINEKGKPTLKIFELKLKTESY